MRINWVTLLSNKSNVLSKSKMNRFFTILHNMPVQYAKPKRTSSKFKSDANYECSRGTEWFEWLRREVCRERVPSRGQWARARVLRAVRGATAARRQPRRCNCLRAAPPAAVASPERSHHSLVHLRIRFKMLRNYKSLYSIWMRVQVDVCIHTHILSTSIWVETHYCTSFFMHAYIESRILLQVSVFQIQYKDPTQIFELNDWKRAAAGLYVGGERLQEPVVHQSRELLRRSPSHATLEVLER